MEKIIKHKYLALLVNEKRIIRIKDVVSTPSEFYKVLMELFIKEDKLIQNKF